MTRNPERDIDEEESEEAQAQDNSSQSKHETPAEDVASEHDDSQRSRNDDHASTTAMTFLPGRLSPLCEWTPGEPRRLPSAQRGGIALVAAAAILWLMLNAMHVLPQRKASCSPLAHRRWSRFWITSGFRRSVVTRLSQVMNVS